MGTGVVCTERISDLRFRLGTALKLSGQFKFRTGNEDGKGQDSADRREKRERKRGRDWDGGLLN